VRTWARATALVGAVTLGSSLGGCGDDAPGESAGDAATMGVRRDAAAGVMGDPSRLVGTFSIELVAEDPITGTAALSSMRGFVRDGPVNELTGWELVEVVDACELQTPDHPFCDPRCGAGAACVVGDVCRDDPTPVSVGTVTVSGVRTKGGASEVRLMRIGPSYQPEAAVDLDYPPADEGAEVRLSTDGGDHAPFEVVTTGIAPLEVAAGDSVPVERDQPLTVSWTPPGADAESTMTALVDLSHHGGSKGRIVCELDDADGELTIDAAIVTALIDLGTAGFPSIKLTRRAVGSTVIESGRVDFAIEDGRELPLDVPGVVSCSENTDCPDGQTCQPTRKCG